MGTILKKEIMGGHGGGSLKTFGCSVKTHRKPTFCESERKTWVNLKLCMVIDDLKSSPIINTIHNETVFFFFLRLHIYAVNVLI